VRLLLLIQHAGHAAIPAQIHALQFRGAAGGRAGKVGRRRGRQGSGRAGKQWQGGAAAQEASCLRCPPLNTPASTAAPHIPSSTPAHPAAELTPRYSYSCTRRHNTSYHPHSHSYAAQQAAGLTTLYSYSDSICRKRFSTSQLRSPPLCAAISAGVLQRGGEGSTAQRGAARQQHEGW
jgi:hypothetical protein